VQSWPCPLGRGSILSHSKTTGLCFVSRPEHDKFSSVQTNAGTGHDCHLLVGPLAIISIMPLNNSQLMKASCSFRIPMRRVPMKTTNNQSGYLVPQRHIHPQNMLICITRLLHSEMLLLPLPWWCMLIR
jgi:hypothetical protein